MSGFASRFDEKFIFLNSFQRRELILACFEEETAPHVFFSRILKRNGFASRFDEKLLFFHFSQRRELFLACLQEKTAFWGIF